MPVILWYSENEEAGSHYTPREVIALMVNLLLIEADEELFVDKKELKILDMATGFCDIVMTQANSQVNTRVLELLQKFKIKKMNSWCAV